MRASLFARLVLLLVPAGTIPLLVFGYLAIRSHYDSVREESLARHRLLAGLLAGDLDREASQLATSLRDAAEKDVLKANNIFLIREAMGNWRLLAPQFARLTFCDAEWRALVSEPPAPDLDGKELRLPFAPPQPRGVSLTPLRAAERAGHFRYHAAASVRGLDGAVIGHLVAEVELGARRATPQTMLGAAQSVAVALAPLVSGGEVIPLEGTARGLWSSALADVMDDDGEAYQVTGQTLAALPARLVVAQAASHVYAAPRRVLLGYGLLLTLFLAIMTVAIALVVKDLTRPIRRMAETARRFSAGVAVEPLPIRRTDELGVLAQTLNDAAAAATRSRRRAEAQKQTVLELFTAPDEATVAARAARLATTQCGAVAAWIEGDPPEQPSGVSRAYDLGDAAPPLRVILPERDVDECHALLSSLQSLVVMALAKLRLVRAGAVVDQELGMASALQRTMVTSALAPTPLARVASHYAPAGRLGGDWCSIIESAADDSLYVIMGDVTGHGLPQGLVTAAVKGALDTVARLVRGELPGGAAALPPAIVMRLLDEVVASMAEATGMHMTAVVARLDLKRLVLDVCNAGHTFPVLLRRRDAGTAVRQLSDLPNHMLGYRPSGEAAPPLRTARYELEPGDVLLLYTDGLTEARDAAMKPFARKLVRHLQSAAAVPDVGRLVDGIVSRLAEHLGGSPVEDDVCLLAVEVRDAAATLGKAS